MPWLPSCVHWDGGGKQEEKEKGRNDGPYVQDYNNSSLSSAQYQHVPTSLPFPNPFSPLPLRQQDKYSSYPLLLVPAQSISTIILRSVFSLSSPS